MTFDKAQRNLLAQLADELIPGSDGFPAASAAGVSGEGLDQVLAARPDLAPALQGMLDEARGRRCQDVVAEWRRSGASHFGVLAEIVPGAYFLNPQVRAKLGYAGQGPRVMDQHPDYLEDGLLQSVIDRGPIYRPTPGRTRLPETGTGPSALRGYNWQETYEHNFAHVPEVMALPEPTVAGVWDFCGLRVNSPLGIAAGPLLNGRWILYYAGLGFDVLTYKTVRSRARACYPLPNLQPVQPVTVATASANVTAEKGMLGSWAVSFGMPSRSPDFWRDDIARTRGALPKEKILSVSVVATPEDHWTNDELARDFACCARWAVESGADCVEANFSCPNVASSDGQLYQQPGLAGEVAAAVRAVMGGRPLLLKIGHVVESDEATALAKAVAPYVDALVMVNCISARVVGEGGQPLFDGQKRGIAGEAIRGAALEQLRLFAGVIKRENLKLKLVGVGGIATAGDAFAQLQAGSHAVQLATSAMLDPGVGLRIRNELGSMGEGRAHESRASCEYGNSLGL